ncbi:glutamine amidotransferase [Erwiniaceae bacterium BAC15a-03b]|uniref:Glutamine amidotransferase n=1 Tax=Winslowiella arboricola TaxID=2978220 RepID=A0A9J6PRH6_9GAMM|nr:glutamine amidotransferase [Winslowiella arboricola]MCU5774798.1 glutamine amidotransferase [Winslowiella arboricola]MCU5780050.1 glutamine amidotransferase [Winslowiella arboricola]
MSYSAKAPLAIIQLEVPPAAVSAQVGEQSHWFVQALQLQPQDYIVVRPHLGEQLPDFDQVSAAILSGSWAMVTDHADWSERTAAWVRGAIEQQLPLLGVCYGHQLMSYALGGEVADNPRGWERGLKPVENLAPGDTLLSALPAQFEAWLSHRQSVVQPPAGAQVLARSALDECQIIRYSPTALSVQFHPEFDAQIMTACLPAGLSDDGVGLQGADWARSLLETFYRNAQPRQVQTG